MISSENPPFKTRRFSFGRLMFGLLLIGTLTFIFAFYMPLEAAHRALAERHRTAAEREQGLRTQLAAARNETDKTKDELVSASGRLEALEETSAARAETQKNFGEGVQLALDRRVARGQLEVRRSPGTVEVWVPDVQVFRPHQLRPHRPGGALLCDVANALKGHAGLLQVEVHFGKPKVTNHLLSNDFPTSWDLTSARAVDAARILVDKCGVEEERVSAAARGHAAVGKLPPRVTGFVVLRVNQQG